MNAHLNEGRRIDIFFYGLFMDEGLLRKKGLRPANRRLATVDNHELRIADRATLVPASGSQVEGVIFSLTHSELEALYADPSVNAYRPEAVLAQLTDDSRIPALCYNLPAPDSAAGRDPEYAARLRALAANIGLSAGYVASIQ
jgi:hypothetical protein